MTEDNGISVIIRFLISIIITIGAIVFYGTSMSIPPQPIDPQSQPDATQVYSVIENVDVLILESYPMQLHLQVSGYHPDGCDVPVQVEQQRDENTISVSIYRLVPPDMICTMNIPAYEDTIVLEGGFEPGTYTIRVNDFVQEITL